MQTWLRLNVKKDVFSHFLVFCMTMNIAYIFLSMLWGTCVIANLIVIMTFFRMKSLCDNYSYWYTTTLVTLDLIFGSTACPLQIVTTKRIISLNHLICDLFILYQPIVGNMEIFVLIGMAINRYICVLNPRLNADQRLGTIKYLISITSITSILIWMIPKHDYDLKRSNCFFGKSIPYHLFGKNTSWFLYIYFSLQSWITSILKSISFSAIFNTILQEKTKNYLE